VIGTVTLRAILLPAFVQVALVFTLGVIMGLRRFEAVKAGQVRAEDVTMGQKNWPARAQAAANAFSNQFEVPVLFFALVPLAILTHKADLIFVVLSWVFVASRIAHAAVYLTTNRIAHRFTAYMVGVAALLVMWLVFAIRVLGTPLPT
jgi:hypothetical protein